MRKFIIRVLLFFVPILLIAYSADRLLSRQLKTTHTESGDEFSVWNDLYGGTVNSNVLIYGSSRAWLHFDPKMISDSLNTTAYNLGINGHNFWLQYFRHQLLLKKDSQPKLIIHSLDYFTLEKRPDLYNPDQFLPYMLFDQDIEQTIAGYKGYQPVDYKLPLIRYYGKKEALGHVVRIMLKSGGDTLVRIRGYRGDEKQWNSDLINAKKLMAAYTIKLDSASIALFDQYLRECRDKKIKIIFVYTPEHIDGQQFVKNREAIMLLYKGFSEKYKIPFLDYSNHPISFQRQYFYNASHMNKGGAELFTRDLIGELKKLKPYLEQNN
jgi:hypothetical protein